jgi:hypothetical protein
MALERSRAKPYQISWPLSPNQIENLELMLQELYDDLGTTNEVTREVEESGGGGGSEITLPLGPEDGGTGLTSYAIGDILYASATTTLSKLGIGTSNFVLRSTGTLPEWGLVGRA